MDTIKMTKSLEGIYRLVLKDNVRIESVKEGEDTHIWSREGNNEYKPFWAVLSPGSHVTLDEPRKPILWTINEMIGQAVVNPRAIPILNKYGHK